MLRIGGGEKFTGSKNLLKYFLHIFFFRASPDSTRVAISVNSVYNSLNHYISDLSILDYLIPDLIIQNTQSISISSRLALHFIKSVNSFFLLSLYFKCF